jgi:hypothetical protein
MPEVPWHMDLRTADRYEELTTHVDPFNIVSVGGLIAKRGSRL